MSKILQGKVISNKMINTAVVVVSRVVPHPIYQKLLRKNKKFKVDTKGHKVTIGQTVKIIETRPMAGDKHFAIFTADKKTEPVVKEKTVTAQKEKKS